MAAGGPRLASDQSRAFVERVAVLVVERHDGALRAGEATVAAVEIQIGIFSWVLVDISGFREPESGEQAAARANGAADADLAQPGAPLRRIAQGCPRPPGQLHRLLDRVLGLLDVPQ